MEKIILGLIGVAAIYFVVRNLWKEAKGEVKCACSHSGCSNSDENKKGCCDK